MDKQSITTKFDIKAGTLALVATTPYTINDVVPDGAPAPLYAIQPNGGIKTIKITPSTSEKNQNGYWAVSFVLISSDSYDLDGKISYTVNGCTIGDSTGTGQQQNPAQQGASASAAQQGTHGIHQAAGQSGSQGAGDYSQTSQTAPPASKLDQTSTGEGDDSKKPPVDRVFSLEFPHLFLGRGAVKLLSTAPIPKGDFEPQTFKFTNNTDKLISVSVYIGRTWVTAPRG